jgi:hypothetical protein
MPQDSDSGKKASRWGLEYGRRIIEKLGGKPVRSGSNEFLLNGECLTIHCAHSDTDSVGVTYKTLDRVIAVLGAFEQPGGEFRILRLSKEQYQSNMVATRSLGASRGKVGIVKRRDFENHGTTGGKVRV